MQQHHNYIHGSTIVQAVIPHNGYDIAAVTFTAKALPFSTTNGTLSLLANCIPTLKSYVTTSCNSVTLEPLPLHQKFLCLAQLSHSVQLGTFSLNLHLFTTLFYLYFYQCWYTLIWHQWKNDELPLEVVGF
jgi:hypothetical protein